MSLPSLVRSDQDSDRPARSTGLIVGAVLAQLIGLAVAFFCLVMAQIVTFGLFGSEPKVDAAVILPLIGIGVATPLGPLVMSLGARRRRWLIVAAITSGSAVVLASLVTWVAVGLGWN